MTAQAQEQKVARHVQEVTGLPYTTCLAATRSARLRVKAGPDFAKRWQDLAIRDATARGQWKKTVAEQHGEAVAGMAESSVLADEQRREWAQRQPRGVEGEIQPLPKAHRQCGNRFCRKSALAGSAFCEDHSDESQPLKSTGRKP